MPRIALKCILSKAKSKHQHAATKVQKKQACRGVQRATKNRAFKQKYGFKYGSCVPARETTIQFTRLEQSSYEEIMRMNVNQTKTYLKQKGVLHAKGAVKFKCWKCKSGMVKVGAGFRCQNWRSKQKARWAT